MGEGGEVSIYSDGGGPAFPTINSPDNEFIESYGMTLRDYFAAQALVRTWPVLDDSKQPEEALIAAKWAYAVADAMLAERAKVKS